MNKISHISVREICVIVVYKIPYCRARMAFSPSARASKGILHTSVIDPHRFPISDPFFTAYNSGIHSTNHNLTLYTRNPNVAPARANVSCIQTLTLVPIPSP